MITSDPIKASLLAAEREFPLEPYLSELEKVVNIDSGTEYVEGCHQVADFFMERMKKVGLAVTRLATEESGRPILIATNTTEESYDLLFVGHMDTVFPEGTVAERPFRLNREEGTAHGAGTIDMKGGVLFMIYLTEYLMKYHPAYRIGIFLNSDEETGSHESKEVLIEMGHKTRYAFVFEGGRKRDQFVFQRKGSCKYEITIHGVSSHAGTAPKAGASAIVEMGHWITKLDKLKNYRRGTSVNIGLIHGGTALNVVPDCCTALMEVRYTDKKEMARIERAIAKLEKHPTVKRTKGEAVCLSHIDPLCANSATEALMNQMKSYDVIYQKELDQLSELGFLQHPDSRHAMNFVTAGGLSDANRLALCNIPIIDGCGPSGGFPHNENEFISLDTLKKRYLFFTGFLPYLLG